MRWYPFSLPLSDEVFLFLLGIVCRWGQFQDLAPSVQLRGQDMIRVVAVVPVDVVVVAAFF